MERLKTVEAERLTDDRVRAALAAEEAERARKAQVASGTGRPAERVPDGDGAGLAAATGTTSGDNPGQTGSGQSPGRIGPSGSNVYGGLDWVCPTGDAPVSFGDTWGAPRGGGRRHEGVDMIGAMGTPILAVVDGFAQAKSNNLGGITVWFTGNDGNKYYYAHLAGYETLGAVTKGTVIAYMGQSGNAQFSVAHVHFQIHRGGGTAVNPFPTVNARCG